MLWLYKRNDEACPIETSLDPATREFVLVINKGLPNEEWERFPDEVSFRARLDKLEDEMAADHWEHVGPPAFLNDGWKL